MTDWSLDPFALGLVLFALIALAFFAPWWVTVLVLAVVVPTGLLVSGQVRRALRRRTSVGAEALPGAAGTVVGRLAPSEAPLGYVVRLGGELWMARSTDDLDLGDRALVVEVEGNHLLVCRLPRELE
jgi:membrane protein implicated in regulation of membrane protease activity